jgi:hypothetical protein
MNAEKLIAGYILRIAVQRNRWRISLHDIATHEVQVFASFKALGEYLELVSTGQKPALTEQKPALTEQKPASTGQKPASSVPPRSGAKQTRAK